MRRELWPSVVLFCGLVLGGSRVSQAADVALVQELEEVLARLNRAVVDGNCEAVLGFYTNDAVLMPDGEVTLAGKAPARGRMEANRRA
jgi:ketosteroid isomerase-like protein